MSYTVYEVSGNRPKEWDTLWHMIFYGKPVGEVEKLVKEDKSLVSHVQVTRTGNSIGPALIYESALSAAARWGRMEVVKLLICEGASIKQIPGGRPEDYPLYQAVQNGHREVAEVLIKKGASMELRIPSSDDMSIFSLAVRDGKLLMARMMLVEGADVNSKDKDGNSPLGHALINPQETASEMLEELVNYGADTSWLTAVEMEKLTTRYKLEIHLTLNNAFVKNIISLSKICTAFFPKACSEHISVPGLRMLVMEYLVPKDLHDLARFYEAPIEA